MKGAALNKDFWLSKSFTFHHPIVDLLEYLTPNYKLNNPILLLPLLAGKERIEIILTDDDQEDQEFFMMAVKKLDMNIHVHICNNGIELLNRLKEVKTSLPDLIFLDINMPLKGGHEVLEEIRSHQDWKAIPVIMYSTSSNPKYIEDAYKKGATFYLCKPDSVRKLELITKRILNSGLVDHKQPAMENFVL